MVLLSIVSLQYFHDASQGLDDLKDSSFDYFIRMLHNDWILANSTLVTGDTLKICQVLTSLGILRMLFEQLLQTE